jgi:hypothetical protein
MRFELMTPEERFTLIENTLKYASELHAQHAEEMLKLSERSEQLQELYRGLVIAVSKLAEGQRASDERLNALIETVDRIIRERGRSPS